MKKRITAVMLILVMIFSFAGCAKKAKITLAVLDIGDYEVVQVPKGFENFATEENTIKMTVKNPGEYPIVIKAEDGTEYTLAVKYEKGSVTVDGGDLSIVAGIE